MFHFLPYFCIHSCEISNIVLANAFSNLSNPLFSTCSAPSLFLALPLHFDKIASWKSPLSHFFWLVTSKLYPTFLANATHNMGSRERSQILQVEKEKYLKHSSTSFEPGLHKLWYPCIRDMSTWSKFGAHGEHGDVFLFSNLGALWFSENLIRYSLHVCLREVKNNLFSFKHSYLRHFSWRF